jgi:hypothetical protein
LVPARVLENFMPRRKGTPIKNRSGISDDPETGANNDNKDQKALRLRG